MKCNYVLHIVDDATRLCAARFVRKREKIEKVRKPKSKVSQAYTLECCVRSLLMNERSIEIYSASLQIFTTYKYIKVKKKPITLLESVIVVMIHFERLF